MPLTQAELKRLILQKPTLEFCRYYLFDQNIYIFENAEDLGIRGTYHDFKCSIGNKLNTSPNNIAIIGSGKFGFSMNPTNDLLRKFNPQHSDLDIVIVCRQRFEEIWAHLRNAYYSNHSQVQVNHAKNIFSKFVIVNDQMEYKSTHMREIIILLDEMKKDINGSFRIKRKINYRIYSDWLDVEAYHQFGLTHLQNALQTPRGEAI